MYVCSVKDFISFIIAYKIAEVINIQVLAMTTTGVYTTHSVPT